MIRALLKFAFVMRKDVDGLIISVPALSGRMLLIANSTTFVALKTLVPDGAMYLFLV